MIGTASFAPVPVLAEGGISVIPLLVVLFVVFQIVRAFRQARAAQAKHQSEGGEADAERRAREIRERLRRVRAERAGLEQPPPEPPPLLPDASHQPRPDLEPESPVKRVWRELEEALAPPAPEPPTPDQWQPDPGYREPAVLERRDHPLEPVRVEMEPLTHARGPDQILPDSNVAARKEARQQVLTDLRDSSSLRRAFVLREVLGPPVGLR